MAKIMYVLIGKFSPFHLGHEALINALLKKRKKLLVLIGSSNKINHKNFLTSAEKLDIIGWNYEWIDDNVEKDNILNFDVAPIIDMDDNVAWLMHVRQTIQKFNHDINKKVVFVTGNPYVKSLLEGDGYEVENPLDLLNQVTIDVCGANCRYDLYRYQSWNDDLGVKGISDITLDYLEKLKILDRMHTMYSEKQYKDDLREGIFQTLKEEKTKRLEG